MRAQNSEALLSDPTKEKPDKVTTRRPSQVNQEKEAAAVAAALAAKFSSLTVAGGDEMDYSLTEGSIKITKERTRGPSGRETSARVEKRAEAASTARSNREGPGRESRRLSTSGLLSGRSSADEPDGPRGDLDC